LSGLLKLTPVNVIVVEPPDAILAAFETVEENVFAPVIAKVTGAAEAAIAFVPALLRVTEIV
jgi:hypothetical protein